MQSSGGISGSKMDWTPHRMRFIFTNLRLEVPLESGAISLCRHCLEAHIPSGLRIGMTRAKLGGGPFSLRIGLWKFPSEFDEHFDSQLIFRKAQYKTVYSICATLVRGREYLEALIGLNFKLCSSSAISNRRPRAFNIDPNNS